MPRILRAPAWLDIPGILRSTTSSGSLTTPRQWVRPRLCHAGRTTATCRADELRRAAGDGQELRLHVGVARYVDGGGEDAGAAPLLGLGGEEVVDELGEVGVEAVVGADAPGQVPGVDDVVGGQLAEVDLAGEVAERQVHRAAEGVGRGGVEAGGGRLLPGGLGILAEDVALEAVADLGHGGPG